MKSSLALVGRASLLAAICAYVSVAYGEVTITGLDGALLDNALIHLGLDDEACDAPQWRVNDRYSRAEQQIRTAVQAYGYYAIDVSASLEFGESCWLASFDVALGEPVRLRDLDISIDGDAQNDPSFVQVVNRTTLQVGEPLEHAAYDQLKRRLLELAQQRGYAEAMFNASQIDVYPADRAADIVLRFDSGPRYTFGEIQFRQDVLQRTFLDGYYEFSRGDPYDRAQLTALYRVLTNSGYFRTVDVRPQTPLADTYEIPVLVELTPANRRAISYGAGFSTDTGPRLRFGRTNRRVNDRGAQSGFSGQLSPVVSEVGYN
jgi:translocation and assembly module TamA